MVLENSVDVVTDCEFGEFTRHVELVFFNATVIQAIDSLHALVDRDCLGDAKTHGSVFCYVVARRLATADANSSNTPAVSSHPMQASVML